ncbi:response regulator [Flavobacterium hungaricum]|uniref:Response regulator n=1 Tax=Flavobacterium hungaricum TaxID=2082725 RepID=A0ABR9TGB4_9FLAO|nr:response regulator [Flavobacterium hungaricum]MBE8724396.1 response regulator [Flavobacterium hungaricum]
MSYKNILLVDDDIDDAEIFKMAVESIDSKIKIVIEDNALKSLNKLKAASKLPEIIFLDYYMPYLDGSEFLKLIREVKGLKKIPVVLYSGQSGAKIKEVIKKFKDVQFLEKKANFRDIVDSLKEIINS